MADNSIILQEEQTSKVLTNNLLLRDSFDNSSALMAIKFGGDIQESDGDTDADPSEGGNSGSDPSNACR